MQGVFEDSPPARNGVVPMKPVVPMTAVEVLQGRNCSAPSGISATWKHQVVSSQWTGEHTSSSVQFICSMYSLPLGVRTFVVRRSMPSTRPQNPAMLRVGPAAEVLADCLENAVCVETDTATTAACQVTR